MVIKIITISFAIEVLKSEGHLSINTASDLTRNDKAVDCIVFGVPVVEQVLDSAARLEVLSQAPAESRIDPGITGDRQTSETRDVVERGVQIKAAPEVEVRMQLELVPRSVAFGSF